jgi:hypothetical protein
VKTTFLVTFLVASLVFYSCDTQTKPRQGFGSKIYKDTCHIVGKTFKNYPPYYLGDMAKLNCQSITIIKCEDDFSLDTSKNFAGQTKNVFLQIRYENNTTDQVTLIEPAKWILIDPAGERYYPILNTEKSPILQERVLLSKESYEGWITFKSPYYNDDFDAVIKVNSDDGSEFAVIFRISLPK